MSNLAAQKRALRSRRSTLEEWIRLEAITHQDIQTENEDPSFTALDLNIKRSCLPPKISDDHRSKLP